MATRSPSFRTCLTAAITMFCGVLLLPPILGNLTTIDGSLDFIPRLIGTILSIFLIGLSVLILVQSSTFKTLGREVSGRILLFWFLAMAFAPLLFAAIETGLWLEGQLANRNRDQIDLRAQEIMRNVDFRAARKLDDEHLLAPHTSDLYNVNERGYRTRDFTPKRPEEWRVVLLGGSTVFGQNLSDQHTLSSYLEADLQKYFGDSVTVWNLGIPGAQANLELKIAESTFDRIQPDQMIVYHGANDFGHRYNEIRGRSEAPLVLNDTIGNRLFASLDRLGTTKLVRLVLSALLAPSGPNLEDPSVSRRIEHAVSSFDATMEDFESFCALQVLTCNYFLQPIVTNQDSLTLFEQQIVASRRWQFPGYADAYDAFSERILSDGTANHIDLRNSLDGQTNRQFFDYVHTTGRANRIIARDIFCALIRDQSLMRKISDRLQQTTPQDVCL